MSAKRQCGWIPHSFRVPSHTKLKFVGHSFKKQRISAHAILAGCCLHPVRFTLHEPLMDAFNLHLSQLSGLLGRQHLAVKPAYATVRGRRMPNDALLLENGDLNSSSLYCGHLGAVVRFAIFLQLQFSSAGKLLHRPDSSLEENRKKIGNPSEELGKC